MDPCPRPGTRRVPGPGAAPRCQRFFRLSKALRVLGAAAVATAPGLTFAGPVHAAEAPAAPFVSEIHYDNSGGNLGEAIEIEAPAASI